MRLATIVARAWGRSRFVATLAVLCAFAPMWLGPLMAPINAALGEASHVCACGMKPGTCGCPECERLEEDKRAEHEEGAPPAMRGGCHDDEQFPAPPVPPCVMPPSFARATLARPQRALARFDDEVVFGRERDRPLLPPPKA